MNDYIIPIFSDLYLNVPGLPVTLFLSLVILACIFFELNPDRRRKEKIDNSTLAAYIGLFSVTITIYLIFFSRINGTLIQLVINFFSGTPIGTGTNYWILLVTQGILAATFFMIRRKSNKPLYYYKIGLRENLGKCLAIFLMLFILSLPFFIISFFNPHYAVFTKQIFVVWIIALIFDFVTLSFFGIMHKDGVKKWGDAFEKITKITFKEFIDSKIQAIIIISFFILMPLLFVFPSIEVGKPVLYHLEIIDDHYEEGYVYAVNHTRTNLTITPNLMVNWLYLEDEDYVDEKTVSLINWSLKDTVEIRDEDGYKIINFSNHSLVPLEFRIETKSKKYLIANFIEIETKPLDSEGVEIFNITVPDLPMRITFNRFPLRVYRKNCTATCVFPKYTDCEPRIYGDNYFMILDANIWDTKIGETKFTINVKCPVN